MQRGAENVGGDYAQVISVLFLAEAQVRGSDNYDVVRRSGIRVLYLPSES